MLAAWVAQAQKLRRHFRENVLQLFGTLDAILLPTTPMTAPRLGQKTGIFGGVEMPLRPHIGIFTQPFSFIGLPVVSVPVWLPDQPLPIGTPGGLPDPAGMALKHNQGLAVFSPPDTGSVVIAAGGQPVAGRTPGGMQDAPNTRCMAFQFEQLDTSR